MRLLAFCRCLVCDYALIELILASNSRSAVYTAFYFEFAAFGIRPDSPKILVCANQILSLDSIWYSSCLFSRGQVYLAEKVRNRSHTISFRQIWYSVQYNILSIDRPLSFSNNHCKQKLPYINLSVVWEQVSIGVSLFVCKPLPKLLMLSKL